MFSADYIFCFSIVFMAGCNLYFGPRIKSERMAMQWSLSGNPTWYAPKSIGLWGIVAFALGVRLLIWTLSTFAPDKVHGVELGVLLFSVIVAATHFITVRAAACSAAPTR
jgi:hypothetical protein